MDANNEIYQNRELLQQFPRGVFIYAPYAEPEAHPTIAQELKDALPGRAVIITPTVSMYPQDMGVKRGNRYYFGENGLNFIQTVLPKGLGSSWENIAKLLLEIKSGEEFTFVAGGKDVDIAGSKKRFTLNTNEYLGVDEKTVKCPLVGQAIRELSKQITKERSLYYGHLDLLLTGSVVSEEEKLYMDENLYTYAKEKKLLDDPLLNAIPVSHKFVEKGGLNIIYVDKTAIVSSKEAVPPNLLNDLEEADYKVVGVGADEFNMENLAGVKCRSLSLDWKE